MASGRLKATLLLAFSVVNLVYIVTHATQPLRKRSSGHRQSYCSYFSDDWNIEALTVYLSAYRGHDHPRELPLPSELNPVLVTMEETVHYLPLGETSDEAWFSVSSAGYGYVRLGPEDRTFVVTMFHELHCLRMLNRAFTKSNGATPDHLRHCLSYIRQGVLCSPDLTLESGNFEEKEFEVERHGGTHTCRNWDQIYHFMDDNYFEWRNRTGYGKTPSLSRSHAPYAHGLHWQMILSLPLTVFSDVRISSDVS